MSPQSLTSAPNPTPDIVDVDEPELEAEPTVLASLSQRVQHRARELQSERPIDLAPPGYEDTLVARYHALGFKEIDKIQQRHRRLPESDRNLYAAADYLINACDDLLEVSPAGELHSTGLRWGREAAKAIWGKEAPSARAALLAIYPPPRDVELVAHANELLEESRASNREVDEELVGESGAASR